MKNPPEQYVISIMSRDRVGIVHEISSAIRDLDGNIADIRQSVLCGYFTMILLASFPSSVTKRAIEQKLAEVDARSDTAIGVMIKKIDKSPLEPTALPENAYVLTASGKDEIGFVATVTSFCVRHNINILDLSTTASEGTYAMILIVDLSQCGSLNKVREDLRQFAQETGMTMQIQHYDIFKAVNEINLPIH